MKPLLLPLLVALGSMSVLPAQPAPRPNVVILLADDLGWRDLGCYGGPVRTPALDGLAAQGVRFTDFYSGAAVCSPSRATLLTGRHHSRTGIYSWIHDPTQRSHLLEREVTLAEVLRQAGYATAHIGKWHLGLPTEQFEKPTPADHGFDYWFATWNNADPSHRPSSGQATRNRSARRHPDLLCLRQWQLGDDPSIIVIDEGGAGLATE